MFRIFHPCINDTKTIQIKEFKSNISNVEFAFISLRKNKKKLYLKISLLKLQLRIGLVHCEAKKKIIFYVYKID